MSRIDELLKEMCPEGIEFKKLKSVCKEIIVPMRDRPKVFDGDIPWCRIEDIEGKYFNDSLSGLKVSEEVIKEMNLKVFPTGTVICSCSASIGVYAINTQPLITNQTFIGLVCSEEIFNKFLLYYMETQTKALLRLSTTGTIPYISRNKFEEFEIPVPPIEIQQEIVRILDKFTELEAELQAELDARKKQYEFAMDLLVANRTDVVDISVGEVFDVITDYTAAGSFADLAKNVVYNDLPDYAQLVRTMDIKSKFVKGAPVYVSESAFKYLWRVNLDSEAVILPNIGANCGEVYYVVPKDLPYENNVLGPNAILLRSTKNNNRYLAYTLQTPEFQRQLRKIISPAGQTKFNKTDLKKLKIKVPSVDEQEKIVELLDKFDAICNDCNYGLPAELESRHKQFEYYRDKLLTFERKVV